MKDYKVTIQNNTIIEWKLIHEDTACITSSIPNVNTSVYRVSIEEEQIVGLSLLTPPIVPISYSSIPTPTPSIEKNRLCSQRFKNITDTLTYVFNELNSKSTNTISVALISKLLTSAFNVVGSKYSNGSNSYADTCRAANTRDIKISSKQELAELISDYYLGTTIHSDKKLKEHLMKYRVTYKFKEDTEVIEQLFQMYPPRNLKFKGDVLYENRV